MLNQTVRWGSVCALSLAMAGFVAAYGNDEQRDTPERGEQPAGQHYRAKTVLGSKVSIEGDVSIGAVDDIVFSDEGYVEYLIVANDNKLVTVPWEAAKFDFDKRTAVVSISQEQYKAIPAYTVKQYPVFSAPQYRVETFKFYGLTPGQERRAIRRGLIPPKP